MATNDGVPEALPANDGVRSEVDYSVVVEHAAARQLAAAGGLMTSHRELSPHVVRVLVEVWATLRAQGARLATTSSCTSAGHQCL